MNAALGALPPGLPQRTYEVGALFQGWLLPLAAVALACAAAVALRRVVPLRSDEAGHSPRQRMRHALRGGLEALAYGAVLAGALLADRGFDGARGAETLLRVGFAVAALWAGFRALDALDRHFVDRFHRQGRPSAATVVPLLNKVSKALWGLLIGLAFLENMGMDVKALLAGLGVGGLAVALAGQKTIENLFGGLMLVLDQPVRVGDYCSFGDKSGEVLEVGLRSIRLRTGERTVITVPNGEFSQLVLENFARRDRILFSATLGLGLDTGSLRLKRIVEALDAVLAADPQGDPAFPRRARLAKVGSASLDVDVYCYHRGADWEAFALWRQDLLMRLLEVVEREGGSLALPTRVLMTEGPAPRG